MNQNLKFKICFGPLISANSSDKENQRGRNAFINNTAEVLETAQMVCGSGK